MLGDHSSEPAAGCSELQRQNGVGARAANWRGSAGRRRDGAAGAGAGAGRADLDALGLGVGTGGGLGDHVGEGAGLRREGLLDGEADAREVRQRRLRGQRAPFIMLKLRARNSIRQLLVPVYLSVSERRRRRRRPGVTLLGAGGRRGGGRTTPYLRKGSVSSGLGGGFSGGGGGLETVGSSRSRDGLNGLAVLSVERTRSTA